jgi:excisionase family DNA binding protein
MALVIPPEGWPVQLRFETHDDLARFIRRRDGLSVRENHTPAPVLLSALEAATLLGISRRALYSRVERGQVKGVKYTGRRLQFHREMLLAKLAKEAR